MEGPNPVDPTPEYVLQLGQREVLQHGDMKGIVNLAVVNSKADQVQLYMVAPDEPIASVDGGCSKATEHTDKQSLVPGSQNLEHDTNQTNLIENMNIEEDVGKNGSMSNLQIMNTAESVTEPDRQGTDFAKNVQDMQVVRELTELGSETSVTSTNVADVTDIKAAKRREKSLLNRRLATIPKRPSAMDKGDKAGVNVQPFTVETLKSVSKVIIIKGLDKQCKSRSDCSKMVEPLVWVLECLQQS